MRYVGRCGNAKEVLRVGFMNFGVQRFGLLECGDFRFLSLVDPGAGHRLGCMF